MRVRYKDYQGAVVDVGVVERVEYFPEGLIVCEKILPRVVRIGIRGEAAFLYVTDIDEDTFKNCLSKMFYLGRHDTVDLTRYNVARGVRVGMKIVISEEELKWIDAEDLWLRVE